MWCLPCARVPPVVSGFQGGHGKADVRTGAVQTHPRLRQEATGAPRAVVARPRVCGICGLVLEFVGDFLIFYFLFIFILQFSREHQKKHPNSPKHVARLADPPGAQHAVRGRRCPAVVPPCDRAAVSRPPAPLPPPPRLGPGAGAGVHADRHAPRVRGPGGGARGAGHGRGRGGARARADREGGDRRRGAGGGVHAHPPGPGAAADLLCGQAPVDVHQPGRGGCLRGEHPGRRPRQGQAPGRRGHRQAHPHLRHAADAGAGAQRRDAGRADSPRHEAAVLQIRRLYDRGRWAEVRHH